MSPKTEEIRLTMADLAIFAVGRRGIRLAQRLQTHLGADIFVTPRAGQDAGPNVTVVAERGLRPAVAAAFSRRSKLVFIMPAGAAIRLFAPLVRDKRSDPAVVAVDEAGRHVVALLSSHLGGGNELAGQVAAIIGATPVITTTAEATGGLAIDLLAQRQGWGIDDATGLTRASAALLDGDPIACYQDAGSEEWWKSAPPNLTRLPQPDAIDGRYQAVVIISDRTVRLAGAAPPATVLRPLTLAVGIGCVRGAAPDELDELVSGALANAGLSPLSVATLATIEAKRTEVGISELAARRGWPVRYFAAAELAAAPAPSGGSDYARSSVGSPAVCEPAALLAAGAAQLLVAKTKTRRATVAVARFPSPQRQGLLRLVGIGPGNPLDLTPSAREAIASSDAVVGYGPYVDQVRPLIDRQTVYSSAIGDELERCRLAIQLARAGQRVALVSSGDAGIYGMAGPALELLAKEPGGAADLEVEVIPGVSAAQAAAALLGAPLMSDFAVISLSDLMTPWEVIQRRLGHLAAADVALAIYNPASARRTWQLERARETLLEHRPPGTPVGIVRNATRPGQSVTITDLAHLTEYPIDMLTVLIVGNSQTMVQNGRMITRRGYLPAG